jgi:nucleoside-diphosphate-sugar epimerase
MIYGTPADRNMWRLLKLLRRSPVVPISGADSLQQPVHVDDLAGAVVASLESRAAVHATYDIAGPEPLTFRQVIVQAGTAIGHRPRLVPIPLTPVITALRLYERLAPFPLLSTEQLERLLEDKVFDIDPARRDLGYTPRPFGEGIQAEAAMKR